MFGKKSVGSRCSDSLNGDGNDTGCQPGFGRDQHFHSSAINIEEIARFI
jgi:hypothetical protein